MASNKGSRQPSAEAVLEFTGAIANLCRVLRGDPILGQTLEGAIRAACHRIDRMGEIPPIPIPGPKRHGAEERSWPKDAVAVLRRLIKLIQEAQSGAVEASALNPDYLDHESRFVERRACYFLGMDAAQAGEAGRPAHDMLLASGYWTLCFQADVRRFYATIDYSYSNRAHFVASLRDLGLIEFTRNGTRFNVRWVNPETDAAFRAWLKAKPKRRRGREM